MLKCNSRIKKKLLKGLALVSSYKGLEWFQRHHTSLYFPVLIHTSHGSILWFVVLVSTTIVLKVLNISLLHVFYKQARVGGRVDLRARAVECLAGAGGGCCKSRVM